MFCFSIGFTNSHAPCPLAARPAPSRPEASRGGGGGGGRIAEGGANAADDDGRGEEDDRDGHVDLGLGGRAVPLARHDACRGGAVLGVQSWDEVPTLVLWRSLRMAWQKN